MVQHLGQELMVHAVGAVDLVVAGQHRHGAHRTRLLADGGVGRAMDQFLGPELQ
jgi:hypothetical protein